jgi:hypothetical protein
MDKHIPAKCIFHQTTTAELPERYYPRCTHHALLSCSWPSRVSGESAAYGDSFSPLEACCTTRYGNSTYYREFSREKHPQKAGCLPPFVFKMVRSCQKFLAFLGYHLLPL